jgi:hypothetical protein
MLILSLFTLPDKVTLTLDRTDWMFGQTPINIMVIGLLIGDQSIPIAFMNLKKRGNSNTLERCQLMKLVLKIIPARRIECLLADREFIGQQWFDMLIKNKVPFAIRIKESTKMQDPRTQQMISVKDYYSSVSRGEYILETQIWGHKVWVLFKKKKKSSQNVVFLAVSSENIRMSALNKYKKRWSIERMFLSMKTHGFNLEQTHLIVPTKLDKLIAAMAIAFAVCCRVDHVLAKQKPIPLKNHGRKLYSIFTYGLICIKEHLLNNLLNPFFPCSQQPLKQFL